MGGIAHLFNSFVPRRSMIEYTTSVASGLLYQGLTEENRCLSVIMRYVIGVEIYIKYNLNPHPTIQYVSYYDEKTGPSFLF